MTSAHYRLLSPAGEASEDGSADVEVTGGNLVLTPLAGDVLRVPFGQIASVAEAEQFTVRVGLVQGTVIELSRLGVMRTQLLAELHDGQGDAAAEAASVVGSADVFRAAAAGEPVEVRVYDDALLLIGAAGSERISFAFVEAVDNADYVVTVRVAGGASVPVSRLGNRTGEFAEALGQRLAGARGRTSAFLGALLPGLDPMALRQAAGLLRDGVAVPAGTLNGVHPDLARTLIEVAALPDRRDAISELSRRAEVAIGFRQISSVHKAAVGTTPWQDHAVSPHIGGHESPGGAFRPGFAGMMAAGIMSGFGPGGSGPGGSGPGGSGFGGPAGFGGGYGGYGGYWAYRALGAGMNHGGQRPMTARADVTRGRLTPATEDYSALTITGDDPSVLAFVLASSGSRVFFEVLNLAEPTTLVFRAEGPGAVAAINRALVDSGFSRPPAAGAGLTAPARPAGQPAVLADLLVGEIPHDARWSGQVSALLSG